MSVMPFGYLYFVQRCLAHQEAEERSGNIGKQEKREKNAYGVSGIWRNGSDFCV